MSNDFVSALKQFGYRIANIQCSPSKKKKRNSRNLRSNSSIVSQDDLPKYILRFSDQNNRLHIEAINLRSMYQLILKENELLEHLSGSGFQDCPWNRYFIVLSSTFSNPSSNITLTKGKGGGYMILSIKYPISNDITLNGIFELGLIDEYCQNEQNMELPSKYKEEIFMSMFESALSQSSNNQNVQILNVSDINNNDNNNNSNNKEAEDDDLKSNNMKSENFALQRKIQLLEQENVRLKVMTQNTNIRNTFDIGGGGIDLTQNFGASLSVGGGIGGIGNSNKPNPRVRKQRDPKMSLMNPRREKRRKVGFQFAGAKK